MEHDFSIVFETDNPYWQRVLDIFAKNEKYEKKVVSNRNLHHKFPRSFSKLLGESVDNDKDNLISLSLSDHFLVHYYYYLLAKKGYRQSMATAFTFMAKKGLKYMTPETAEAMAKDYADARAIANQHIADTHKGMHHTEESRRKMSESQRSSSKCVEWRDKLHEMNKGMHHSEETRRTMSESHYGKNNPFYGKNHTDETRRKIREAALRREARKRGETV